MAGKSLLAVQYERQYAEAIDRDYKFTTVERTAYLSNPLRYSGQVIIDSDEDALYRLNVARDEWILIAGGGVVGHTIQDAADISFTQRANLKFIGATVTDNVVDDTTEVSITGGVSSVNSQTGVVVLDTDDISETGSPTNKWFTESRVLSTILTGFTLATATAINASDSILIALGKIQAQFNANLARFQNALTYDGTGTKFPSVDAVNSSLTRNTKLFGYTGITHKKDTVNLTPVDTAGVHSVDIAAVTSALFWDELFTAGQVSDDAFKSFPAKNYLLSQLETATGGNINQNPITTNGLFVRYIGYNKLGNIVSSASNFLEDKTVVQLGFVTVLRAAGVITFLGGATVGARNVFNQPILASSLELDRTLVQLRSDVVIGFNTGAASLRSANGSIYGLSINWRSVANPNNDLPIDRTPYTGVSTITFASINPLFLTQTSAPTPHTLWTELEGGIAINNSIFNTTTQLRATLDNNKFSIKRVLIGTRGGLWLQDGEHVGTAGYATIDAAKAALSSHVFTDSIIPPGVVTEIARIAFKKGVTDFTNAADFYITSTFSGAGSGSTGGSASFAGLTGNPTDNTLLAADLSARALNLLTGYTIGANTAVLTSDTVMQGIGKVEKKTNDNTSLKSDKNLTLSYQAGPYTLVLADNGAFVEVDNLTATTLTVPPNSSVAFPIGTQIVGTQFNSGQVTITAGSGVTINAEGGKMKTVGQYSGFTLIKTATDTWFLFGGLTA